MVRLNDHFEKKKSMQNSLNLPLEFNEYMTIVLCILIML